MSLKNLKSIVKFLKNNIKKYNGGDSWVEIPVPISNTEVKHSNVENSGSEDRKLPFFLRENIEICWKKTDIVV